MKRIFLILIIVSTIILLNIDNSFLSYSEEKHAEGIVIRDKEFSVEEYVSELKFPVMIDFIGKDMIVIEKDKGTVKIIKNDILQSEPILQLEVSKTIEEGLVGILVKNDNVFVHHTTKNIDDGTTSNWFTKYYWNGEKLVNPIELLSFHSGNGMHNSGVMIMDENGKVFGGIGDIGNKNGLYQNTKSGIDDKTGSIIALEDSTDVYAIGIRNTYGLDFDPITGVLWDTENGPEVFDEVNLVKKKFNSGWNKIQGPITKQQEIPVIEEFEYSDPEFSWEKPAGLTAIHFINSKEFEKYQNSVLVGSFHDGILYKFELNENRNKFEFQNEELKDLVLNIDDNPNEIIFGTGFSGITDIKEGPDGNIYIVSIGDGKIYRLFANEKIENTKTNCEDFSSSNDLSECNFSKINLSDINFSYKELKFTDFSDTNLVNINFEGANLVGVNFDNSIISNSNFFKANLDSSIFKNYIIKKVNFSETSMISNNFDNANLEDSIFDSSNLERIVFKNTKIDNVVFDNTDLINADLTDSDMSFVSFDNADLSFSNFSNTNLVNAQFDNAKLWKTKLNNVEFTNASFIQSDNYYSEFKKSKLENADFSSSRLSNVNFNDANLSNSNFLNVFPINSSFDNANLEDSILNTCLKHDFGSRILNKVLRSIDSLELEFLEIIIVKICN